MTVCRPPKPANRLLESSLGVRRHDFLACCEHVDLAFATVLCQAGERIRHVYFPIGAFISLVTTLDAAAELEVGIIGDEGMLGVSLTLGVDISSQQAIVQGSGAALRMSSSAFKRQLVSSPQLQQHLHRYVYVLMDELARTASCIHSHRMEARLARWLLMSRDRAHSNRFDLTQKFLASMLGVRRAGITVAASSLQARGLISYSRGTIVIHNGKGLESISCRCYQQDKAVYERALGKQRGTTRGST